MDNNNKLCSSHDYSILQACVKHLQQQQQQQQQQDEEQSSPLSTTTTNESSPPASSSSSSTSTTTNTINDMFIDELFDKCLLFDDDNNNTNNNNNNNNSESSQSNELITKKDLIIKKQQDEINNLKRNLYLITKQRDYLVELINKFNNNEDIIINNNTDNDTTTTTTTSSNKPITIDTSKATLIISNNNNNNNNNNTTIQTNDTNDGYNILTDVINNNNLIDDKMDEPTTTTIKQNNKYEYLPLINGNSIELMHNNNIKNNKNNKNNNNNNNNNGTLLLHRSGYLSLRANRAAKQIQKAYREYKLKENYKKLCENTSMKRRSLDMENLNKLQFEQQKQIQSKINERRQSSSKQTMVPLNRHRSLEMPNTISDTPLTTLPSNVNKSVADNIDIASANFENLIENFDDENNNTKLLLDTTFLNIESGHLLHKDNSRNDDDVDLHDDLHIDSKIQQKIKEKKSTSFNGNSNSQNGSQNSKNKMLNDSATPSNSCSSVHSVYSNSTSSSSGVSSNNSNKQSINSLNIEQQQQQSTNQTTKLQSISNTNFHQTPPLPLPQLKPQTNISNSHKNTVTINNNNKTTPKKVNKATTDRKYLIGVNLFNRKPELGIRYLMERTHLEITPQAVAKFLIRSRLLSRQMIGEYISNTKDKFIKLVLLEYCNCLQFKNLPIDEALRLFQSHFRMTGEAQRIEYLTSTFANCYYEQNFDEMNRMFKSPESTLELLSYAIIMLNTITHNPSVKPSERMTFQQFITISDQIDGENQIDRDYLKEIYERVRLNELKPDTDPVTAVLNFEKTLIGKPTTSIGLPHRRLISCVKLFEVRDLAKKEKLTSHQRDVFLFNDLLVITKSLTKKKSTQQYTFRTSFSLSSMDVFEFQTEYYQFGIRLLRLPERKVLITFNARNKHDQKLFCDDLSEAIAESNEVEYELEYNKNKETSSESSKINEVIRETPKSNTDKNELLQNDNNITSKSTFERTISNSLIDLSQTINNETYIKNPIESDINTELNRSKALSDIYTTNHNNYKKIYVSDDINEQLEEYHPYNKKKQQEVIKHQHDFNEQNKLIVVDSSKYTLPLATTNNCDSLLSNNNQPTSTTTNNNTNKSTFEIHKQKYSLFFNKSKSNAKLLASNNNSNNTSTISTSSTNTTNTTTNNNNNNTTANNQKSSFKYSTLSASTGKSLDKSLRSMFKYINIYNSSNNNSNASSK